MSILKWGTVIGVGTVSLCVVGAVFAVVKTPAHPSIRLTANATEANALSKSNNARATVIVQAMYDTYNKMQSFSYTSSCVSYPVQLPGASVSQPVLMISGTYLIKMKYKVRFERQYKSPMDYDYGSETVVADGKYVYANGTGSQVDPSHYLKLKLDTKYPSNGEVEIEDALRLYQDLNDTWGRWLPGMPLHADWLCLRNVPPWPAGFTFGGETWLDGKPMDTIIIGDGSYKVILLIGHDDHLLHQQTQRTDNGTAGIQSVVDTYADLKVNPDIPDSVFVYSPPSGTTEINDMGEFEARRPL